MKLKYLLFISVASLLFAACEDDEKLVAREGNEWFFTFPQGDHDFDNRIVEFNKEYGFFPLYEFQDKDIYWNGNNWDEHRGYEYELRGSLKYKVADIAYIDKQLDLLEECFLSCFSVPLLKRMPAKLLLCSELMSGRYDYEYDDEGHSIMVPIYDPIPCYKSMSFVAVNYCGINIETITVGDKAKFSREMGVILCDILVEKGDLVAPDDFIDVSKSYYKYSYTDYKGLEVFKPGFLNAFIVTRTTNYDGSVVDDFKSYVLLVIQNSLDKLINGALNPVYEWTDYPDLSGVFKPERDVNGRVKKKYDIVVKYLKEKGINAEYFQNLLN